jgi:hypothetical protein
MQTIAGTISIETILYIDYVYITFYDLNPQSLNMPPISDDEFNKGKKYTGLSKEILSFLCENKRKAYTIIDLIEEDLVKVRLVNREIYYKCK